MSSSSSSDDPGERLDSGGVDLGTAERQDAAAKALELGAKALAGEVGELLGTALAALVKARVLFTQALEDGGRERVEAAPEGEGEGLEVTHAGSPDRDQSRRGEDRRWRRGRAACPTRAGGPHQDDWSDFRLSSCEHFPEA